MVFNSFFVVVLIKILVKNDTLVKIFKGADNFNSSRKTVKSNRKIPPKSHSWPENFLLSRSKLVLFFHLSTPESIASLPENL